MYVMQTCPDCKYVEKQVEVRKWFVLVLALLLLATGVNAQKVDQRLTRLVEKYGTRSAQNLITQSPQAVKRRIAVEFNADGTLRSVSAMARLKQGAVCPTENLRQMGIEVRYVVGDMVALRIPADKLLQLEQVEEFSYVNADEMLQPMNDQSRAASKVDQVADDFKRQSAGLPQAYTGKGVVLGIIDQGIDYNHAAFRHDDGSTRIVKLIEYFRSEKNVYTTDAEIKEKDNDSDLTSHGTHVASAAGGSNLGNGLQGMAPEADLILCGLGNYTTTTNAIECIKEIFDYAESAGKPAVVNISMGVILGLHDGGDDMSRGIGILTQQGTLPGRVVVSSVANSGARNQSIVKTLSTTSEELKTVLGANEYPTALKPDETVNYRYSYLMYADDYQDFTPTLKLVNLKTGELLGEGDIEKAGLDATIPQLDKTTRERLNGEKAIVYGLDLRNRFIPHADYRYALIVKAGHDGQTIKMMCNGDLNTEPCFNAPAPVDGSYDFAANGYTVGSGDFAFNTTICNEGIISAGFYLTRTEWTDHQGVKHTRGVSPLTHKEQVIGEIGDASSYGIADNGLRCPTVIAPGGAIISGASNYYYYDEEKPGEFYPDLYTGDLCTYVNKHGRDNWYMQNSGSSMASSMVTGIVALWLQANPKLSVLDIREVMKETCVNDEWTTNADMIPSHNTTQAGYGKIDCLAGLKEILGTTAIETIGADGRREATPATMYNVDAPVYNMMGQRVDKSQKGLVIYKGKKYVNK